MNRTGSPVAGPHASPAIVIPVPVSKRSGVDDATFAVSLEAIAIFIKVLKTWLKDVVNKLIIHCLKCNHSKLKKKRASCPSF
jgi:hypothetical protein